MKKHLFTYIPILVLCIQDEEAEKEKFINPEITESMWLEMEYDADRAW